MATPASRRMDRNDPRAGRVILFVFLVIPLLFLISVLGRAIIDIGPAGKVRDDRGIPGIYHVTNKSCGQRGCSISGDFTATGAQSPILTGVDLQQDSTPSTGDDVPAVDVDGKVYRPGSTTWIWDMWSLILGSLGLLLWIWAVLWRPLRRRRGAMWNNLYAPLR